MLWKILQITMATWRVILEVGSKTLVFLCLLYATIGTNWYNYQGHCKDVGLLVNGRSSLITKGLWKVCVKPALSDDLNPAGSLDESCHSIFYCNLQTDGWYKSRNITRMYEGVDDLMIISETLIYRSFVVLSFICAKVALLCTAFIHQSYVPISDRSKKLFGIFNYVSSILTPILCWCWLCFWMLLWQGGDGRDVFYINGGNDNSGSGYRAIGRDDIESFSAGSSFYGGLVAWGLSNLIGFWTLIILFRKCCKCCRKFCCCCCFPPESDLSDIEADIEEDNTYIMHRDTQQLVDEE